MLNFRLTSILICISLMSACSSSPPLYKVDKPTSNKMYKDNEFNLDIDVEQEEDIYAVTPEMVDMLNSYVGKEKNYGKQARRLVEMIFDTNYIGLAYQNNATLTASETYHSKTANCLSLTVMAYALAKEFGISVRFQDVSVPEYWERNGEYNFLTGHVNLRITEPKGNAHKIMVRTHETVIDFDTQISRQSFPSRIVSKNTVTAMFYTNKGAQAIVDEDYDLAYRYLKEATLRDPKFSPAWGNLGVLYRFKGLEEYALRSYEKAIYLNPKNLTAVNNLALLKFKLGDYMQANKLRAGIHRLRRTNPYYQALLASEAFYAGDYHLAVGRYKRAIKLNDKVHEFHFGLAKSLHYAGQYQAAELAMKKAIKLSPYPDTDEKYVAKLTKMRYLSQSN